VDQPGYIRADLEAPLAANITGYLEKMNVDIGEEVKAGQVLAEIAVPEIDKEVIQKDAVAKQMSMNVEQAKKAQLTAHAQVEAAAALVKEAEAGMLRAEANWQRWSSESKRITEMAKNKVIDIQTRDETNRQADAAAAAKEEVHAKVVSAQAMERRWQTEEAKAAIDILAEQARLEVAQADAERLKALQQYKYIRAPFAGIVTRRKVDPGHYLQPGKPEYLLVIAATKKVRVVVEVPEAEAARVKDKNEVTIGIQALGVTGMSGKVSRSAWSLDSQSRTLHVEIDLDNPDGKYRPGMYAYVRLHIDLPAVRAIPTKTLSKAGETMACFVLQDGKAVRTKVKAGRSDGELTEVVSLLKPGTTDWVPFTGEESIIANPPPTLTDGAAVEVAK
jgi:RND family efflux transporter MFP subunit